MAGCASETVLYPAAPPPAQVQSGRSESAPGPGLESQYLVTLADSLAGSITDLPRIANAKSTPRIVMDPLANNTRIDIDRGLFLTRVRILLNQRAMNRVRFLDRGMLDQLEREGQPEFRGVDYVLAGRFDPVAEGAAAAPRGFVVCGFRLSDSRTGSVVWEGSYSMSGDNMASLLSEVL
jgi:hypothetical protein